MLGHIKPWAHAGSGTQAVERVLCLWVALGVSLAIERYSSPHEHLDFFLFSEVKYEAVLSIFCILKCKKFGFIKELTISNSSLEFSGSRNPS